MTATLAPIPFLRYTSTSTGLALVGGQVFTYAAGTTTPQATYTDSTGNTSNTNPIILNSRGECTCYLNPSLSYKLVFKDSLGNTISTYDNIRALDYAHSVFYVEDFGATGDGVTDDTAAIQAAINLAPTGAIVAFGVGTFKVSSLTVSKAITLRGSGKWSTIIAASSATADVITITTASAVGVSDMWMQASVTRTAGAYIKVQPASNWNFDSFFHRVLFDRPFTGISFLAAADFTVDDCYFASYTSEAIRVANTASPDSGDSIILGNTFDGSGHSGTAISQVSSGGLRVIGNKFLGGAFHYLGQYSSASSTSILLFHDNSSEAASNSNLAFNAVTPTTFSLVSVQGNEIAVLAGATGVGIIDPGYDFLDAVTIGNNNFSLDTGSVAIGLGRGTRVSILPNNIASPGTGTTGVSFAANLGTTVVHPQDIRGASITRYSGTMTNVTFVPGGLVQTGTNTDTTNTAYGTLFSAPVRAVTFATPYPKPPTVTFNLLGGAAVGVAFSVLPTTTGFSYAAIGATTATGIGVTWTATGG